MSQLEVTQFIIVAPAGRGKAVQWAKQRLLSHLEGRFPRYQFRLEPFGPLADEGEFLIVPIMNRIPKPGEQKGTDEFFMLQLPDPSVLSDIADALRLFDVIGASAH